MSTEIFPNSKFQVTDLRMLLPESRTPTSPDLRVVEGSLRNRWVRRYRLLIQSVDLVALVAAGVAGLLARNGAQLGDAAVAGLGISAAWLVLLLLGGAYDRRNLGSNEEMRRVFDASIRLAALVGFLSWLGRPPVGRSYILTVVLLGTIVLLCGRVAGRFVLRGLRRRGRCRHRVLAIGSAEDVEHLTQQAGRALGFEIVAACVPGGRGSLAAIACPVPVLGRPEAAAELGLRIGVDTLAVTNDEVLGRPGLRRLAWRIEGTGLRLLLAPALTDVAGPRVSIRPLAGLPLLHVDSPTFSGARWMAKAAFDRILGLLLLLFLSPVFLALAVAVRLDSSGPALYWQQRVGLRGRTFSCCKFRSMVVDADSDLDRLRDANNADGLLFKVHRDPRVTRVGRLLRRYSLDELPQLFNVVLGSMSLVGPRPPLPTEVDRYEDDVRRRLLVKPGITGLWQVSGRSDLSWDESVRLDLFYVENWSPLLDLIILVRTGLAVLGGRGAY